MIDIIEDSHGGIMLSNITYIHIHSEDHLQKTLIESVIWLKWGVYGVNNGKKREV